MMKSLLLIVIFIIPCFETYGFRLTPMVASIIPDKANNMSRFTIKNDSFEKIAIESKITKRIMDKFGVETRPITKNKFQIYPEQFILKANEQRTIQVKWLPNNKINSEESYRLIIEQLPINLSKKKNTNSSIKIQMRYLAALYVTPQKAVSQIKLKTISKNKEVNKIDLLVANNGTKHAILKNLKLIFKVEGFKGFKKEYELKGPSLKGMSGENILSKSERLFTIELPEKLKNKLYKTLNVMIYFEQE